MVWYIYPARRSCVPRVHLTPAWHAHQRTFHQLAADPAMAWHAHQHEHTFPWRRHQLVTDLARTKSCVPRGQSTLAWHAHQDKNEFAGRSQLLVARTGTRAQARVCMPRRAHFLEGSPAVVKLLVLRVPFLAARSPARAPSCTPWELALRVLSSGQRAGADLVNPADSATLLTRT